MSEFITLDTVQRLTHRRTGRIWLSPVLQGGSRDWRDWAITRREARRVAKALKAEHAHSEMHRPPAGFYTFTQELQEWSDGPAPVTNPSPRIRIAKRHRFFLI